MCPLKKKKKTKNPNFCQINKQTSLLESSCWMCILLTHSLSFLSETPQKGGLAFKPLSYPTFLLLSDLPSFFSNQDPFKVSTKRWGDSPAISVLWNSILRRIKSPGLYRVPCMDGSLFFLPLSYLFTPLTTWPSYVTDSLSTFWPQSSHEVTPFSRILFPA